MSNIYRGSWIPVTEKPNNQRYLCPYCGETVYMPCGTPTYPTCPWCVSDMPEADDFDTPEELADAKRGNKANTGKKYSVDPNDNENKRAKRRAWYAENRERECAYNREYYEKHREELLAKQRERYRANKTQRLEYQKKYREEHRDEIREAQRAAREADPERFRAYNEKSRGKSMREVEAHIRGVPVEEIPRNGFYFGKGIKR